MKNKIKKLSAICLSFTMMVGMISATAYADSYNVNGQSEEIISMDRVDSNYLKKAGNVKYLAGSNRFRTAVAVSKSGWPNGSDTLVVVNSKNPIFGIIATPLATSNDAPILITESGSLFKDVKSEIKRLKPKNVILVGDRELISKNVSNEIKSVTNANIERIFGKYPSDLSASVAKFISKKEKPREAFVVSVTNGVADALTISSKAGEDKSPILVVDNTFINQDAMNYLKNNIGTVYYVGGKKSISPNLVSKISNSIDNAGENNRVFGNNRHETNVNVINKFYRDKDLKSVVITKSDNNGLIDTVCAGPFATLKDAPVIITDKNIVPNVTKELLNQRVANNIYQIGGGIKQDVTNSIVSMLQTSVGEIPEVKPDIAQKPVQKPENQQKPEQNTTDQQNTVEKPQQNQKPEVKPQDTTSDAPQSIRGGIRGKKIVIDPGHGGKDTGAVGINGIREKDWTLKTALSCANELRKAGAIVIMTRTSDVYPSLQDRADDSNNANAAFFCSIHYNKGGNVINSDTGELSGTGVEVYKGENDFANLAAKNVLNNILSNFALRSRGVKDGTMLYVIKNTNAPAILVEGGFVSNSRDVSILNNDQALTKMGQQIARGIIQAFDQMK